MENPTYIGDGVYAFYDGFGIELRLGDHRNSRVVYLEPSVLRALNLFAESVNLILSRNKPMEKPHSLPTDLEESISEDSSVMENPNYQIIKRVESAWFLEHLLEKKVNPLLMDGWKLIDKIQLFEIDHQNGVKDLRWVAYLTK